MTDYPALLELTDLDLVLLLAEYVKTPALIIWEEDAEFIEAVKAELRTRSGQKVKADAINRRFKE